MSCRVLKNSKVLSRIGELQGMMQKMSLWKSGESISTLAQIARNKAIPSAAKISAVEELNQMCGSNVPQKHGGTGADGKTSALRLFP